MKNSVKNFELQEEYINLLNELIGDIQNEIEESITNGDWYKKITYEIDANDYDEETIDQIIEDIDFEDFKVEGFKIAMQINDNYTVDYYISVDTDVNCGHLDYKLMDKLLTNNYLHYIEDIERYIKAFGEDKKLIVDNDGQEIIVINHDPEEKAKVTFHVGDWGKWEHYVERIED